MFAKIEEHKEESDPLCDDCVTVSFFFYEGRVPSEHPQVRLKSTETQPTQNREGVQRSILPTSKSNIELYL